MSAEQAALDYAEAEGKLDEFLEHEEAASLEEMAVFMNIPAGKKQPEEIEKPPQPAVDRRPGAGRGRGRGAQRARGRQPRGGGTGRGALSQASSAIASMMKTTVPPVPTETDVMERKVDEMSEVSSRLEHDLEEERQKRVVLETRLKELELSHNQLATQYVQLATVVNNLTKGHAAGKTGSTTTASHLVREADAAVGSAPGRSLPPPQGQQASQPARGGLASGRRRGGL